VTKTNFVFAYGSNMNPAQMARRCPSAKFYCIGRLEEHQLRFVGYSGRWNGGVATVSHKRRSRVLGIVWTVNDKDLERLDGFEGVPFVYERVPVPVKIDGSRRNVWCHTYVKVDDDNTRDPSAAYLTTILAGYEWAGARPAVGLLRLYDKVKPHALKS
jgi:gamma-glutamylcyclotransferase (GGCT)/AIG2-like uncharacterized protein YtfP